MRDGLLDRLQARILAAHTWAVRTRAQARHDPLSAETLATVADAKYLRVGLKGLRGQVALYAAGVAADELAAVLECASAIAYSRGTEEQRQEFQKRLDTFQLAVAAATRVSAPPRGQN